MKIISWVLRILAAVIMLQTLFFKFTGADESVQLFTILGVEPWGRIGLGVFELIAAILILIPRTYLIGAIITVGLMFGAIATHLFLIGIKFGGDYILFTYAVVAFVAALILIGINRQNIFDFLKSGFKFKNLLMLFLLFFSLNASSQIKKQISSKKEFDFTATVGQKQGSLAFGFDQLFLVSKKRWQIGYGVRLTNYLGDKRDFITAGPARYTRSFTAPFLIFFAGQREVNFDTLVVQMPIVFSLNAAFHSAYQFNNKLSAGFNIDVIGFTIARKTSAVFKSNGLTRTDPSVKPTNFNLLLTGDHDLGTLNSEVFLKYNWNNRWSYKLVYQFLFVEYKSSLYKQQFSDGVETNRFRNKVNAFGLGVTYNLKSK